MPKNIEMKTAFKRLPEQVVRFMLSFLDCTDLASCDIACRILSLETEKVSHDIIKASYNHFPLDWTISMKFNMFLMTKRRIVVLDGHGDYNGFSAHPDEHLTQKYLLDFVKIPQTSDALSVIMLPSSYIIVFRPQSGNLECAVELYDVRKKEWTSVKSNLPNLRRASVYSTSSEIIISGGYLHDQRSYSKFCYISKFSRAFMENPTSAYGLFTSSKDMVLTAGRCEHGSLIFRNQYWVAGGRVEGQHGSSSSVIIFDLRTKSWIEGPSMNVRRANLRLLLLRGCLYAVGGDRNANNVPLPLSIEKYDESQNQWRKIAQLGDECRSDYTITNCGSKIIVIKTKEDTRRASCHYNDVIESFDIRTGVWDANPQEFPHTKSSGGSRSILAVPVTEIVW